MTRNILGIKKKLSLIGFTKVERELRIQTLDLDTIRIIQNNIPAPKKYIKILIAPESYGTSDRTLSEKSYHENTQ